MEIECPSCHLRGKVNELELPPPGRDLNCPRCKKSFHVDKPQAPAGSRTLMSTCPACQYSTFTEETFAVCPKCGTTAESHQALARKKQEREQAARDKEAINRNYRNPDLVKPAAAEIAGRPDRAPESIEITARLSLAVGAVLLVYGGFGLMNYYSRDWQAVLSEPVLVPVTKIAVFFRLGLIPWSVTLYSLYLIWAAYQFEKVRKDSLRRLRESAWCGVGVAVIYEAVEFGNVVRLSSGTSTFSYYAVGLVSSLFWAALLSAPFVALALYLKSDRVSQDFEKASELLPENFLS